LTFKNKNTVSDPCIGPKRDTKTRPDRGLLLDCKVMAWQRKYQNPILPMTYLEMPTLQALDSEKRAEIEPLSLMLSCWLCEELFQRTARDDLTSKCIRIYKQIIATFFGTVRAQGTPTTWVVHNVQGDVFGTRVGQVVGEQELLDWIDDITTGKPG
jgi:hypothetical protein